MMNWLHFKNYVTFSARKVFFAKFYKIDMKKFDIK